MTRWKKCIVIAATAAVAALPMAAYGDIVFDPSNYAQAVIQVQHDVQLVPIQA